MVTIPLTVDRLAELARRIRHGEVAPDELLLFPETTEPAAACSISSRTATSG